MVSIAHPEKINDGGEAHHIRRLSDGLSICAACREITKVHVNTTGRKNKRRARITFSPDGYLIWKSRDRSVPALLHKTIRIQRQQLLVDEMTSLANQFAIQVDIRTDADKIPVNGALISVGSYVVAFT